MITEKKTGVKSGNISFISFASFISAMSVVFIHSNKCFWDFSSTARYWKTANIIECFFYFAVPVFFMITGATLIDYNKRYTLKEYIKKRVSKTIIPYLAWSILGLIIKVFYLKSVLPETVTPEYVISGILQGNLIGIYWFFIPLFCVYLSIPLFSAVSDEKKKDIFTYVCVVCFIINALVPFVLKVVPFDVGFSAVIRIGSGYLLFVLIGYLITKYEIPLAIRIVFYVLAIFGFILQVIGTYFFSMKAGEIVSIFKGYENVPSILQSVGVFVFFKYIGSRIMKIGWINILINFFSKYTFPLYLLHWYILEMVLKEFSVEKTSMFFRLATPFIALGITVGITFLIRKVPVLRRILP